MKLMRGAMLAALLAIAPAAAYAETGAYGRVEKLRVIAALTCESDAKPLTEREVSIDQSVPYPRDARVCAGFIFHKTKGPYGFGLVSSQGIVLFSIPGAKRCEGYDILVVSLHTGAVRGFICGEFLLVLEFTAQKGLGSLRNDSSLPGLLDEHLKEVWPWFREEWEKRRARAVLLQ